MNIDIKPMQHILLWRLAVGGGADFLANLPTLQPAAQRTALVKAGLISEGKRVNPAGKSKAPVKLLVLTDAGWAWCQAHMHWPPKSSSPQAGKVLEVLLPRLAAAWQGGELVASISDLFGRPKTASPAATVVPQAAPVLPDLHQAIREACRQLAQNADGGRVRLADLRARLPVFNPDGVSTALWELADRGELSLYRLDDPREIRPEDRAAAVRTSTGEEKHILYFGGARS